MTREEIEAYAKADLRAAEIADKGGSRPRLEPLTVAIVTGVGVFSLLEIFAAITLPSLDRAFWPVVMLTSISTGTAAGVQWWREKAWFARWFAAILSHGRAPDRH